MGRIRILKFGGATLRNGAAVRRMAGIVAEHGGGRPLLVVSAHEGVTAMLERCTAEALRGRSGWEGVRIRHRTILAELGFSSELLDRHLRELRAILEHVRAEGRLDRRTRDFVLSFGERMSARVVAEALRHAGMAATPVDAFDLGLLSEGETGRTQPREGVRGGMRAAVAEVPGIAVVTGFIALDQAGDLTTLGRNGSDLTAVWMGAAVGAEEIHLWKSVDGVMTADPRRMPRARPIERLGYAEAAELAAQGAEILHPGALEPAERAGIPIRIRNAERPQAPGTRIDAGGRGRGPIAIAHRQVEIESGLASLALVGRGVGSDDVVAGELLEVTRRAGIAARPGPCGPESQVLLVAADELDAALQEVHRAWFEPSGRASGPLCAPALGHSPST